MFTLDHIEDELLCIGQRVVCKASLSIPNSDHYVLGRIIDSNTDQWQEAEILKVTTRLNGPISNVISTNNPRIRFHENGVTEVIPNKVRWIRRVPVDIPNDVSDEEAFEMAIKHDRA